MGLFFNEMVGLVRVEGVDTAGGAADSSASLLNGNARGGWLDFTFPPIAKARWMGHPRRGWRMEEQQIPPLRYGMEIQGADCDPTLATIMPSRRWGTRRNADSLRE